ncbi:DUF3784 domain-containing protein [Anaeromicropila herbilytica]|uniref:DUF3784 domain-containing protein n=1 Tax=Anaeromicropila herbilytica TaxID=2785025 RepID=A0A7R7IDE5_9FIRM|nr:DUF3784 domain-containing protein [Anaeromicropila herbilytica]BCN31477.1 hypothetical protein bsdtb5_27720 [Anaeromicropila herbilytica]
MFELIMMSSLGILIIIIGWLIWVKERINLIHDYHHTKVSEEDKKPYTTLMGKGTCLMGFGIFLSGIIDYVSVSEYGFYAFGIGFIGGIIIMLIAQFKYNGGLF